MTSGSAAPGGVGNPPSSARMQLSLRYLHLPADPAFDALIERSLRALSTASRIDEAWVTVEQRSDESPAFVTSIKAVVPGPDFQVEMRDHTPRQAILRALAMLEQRMRKRCLRRARQRISHRKHEANFRIGRRSR